MANFTIQSGSDEQTLKLGRIIGSLLKEGDIVGLMGELGSGKTRFTKGIAEGLGISPTVVVTSPSFALVNEYQGEVTLYHLDIYRLESQGEFYSAALEEYLYGSGVAVMEWADRWPEVLPDYSLRIQLEIVDDHRRNITFSGTHPRAEEIIESFMKGVEKA